MLNSFRSWIPLKIRGAAAKLIGPRAAAILRRRLGQLQPSVPEVLCIYPWIHLNVTEEGFVRVCCKYAGLIEKDGAPMSLRRSSVDEIWNSADLRGIRRDMARGRQITACSQCYEEERTGGVSMRVRDTAEWMKGGFTNLEQRSLRSLLAESRASDFRVEQPPRSFYLNLGNLCNLKCRMCFSRFSSRIESDPIHSQWSSLGSSELVQRLGQTKRAHVLDASSPETEHILWKEVLSHPEQIRHLYFMGGETLLHEEMAGILKRLIAAGAAPNIHIGLVSNGTVVDSEILKLLGQFGSCDLGISIDGFDRYYEYIRYPAKWTTLDANLTVLRGVQSVRLSATVTLQAYNALNIVSLLRFLDSRDIPFYVYPIEYPAHLKATLLPAKARRIAAARLREYAAGDCKPIHRALVTGLAAGLDPGDRGPEELDPAALREFMLFTNDLDASRKQSFEDVHGELLELLRGAGFQWKEETRFAGPGRGASNVSTESRLD